jgi:hypothetical protein
MLFIVAGKYSSGTQRGNSLPIANPGYPETAYRNFQTCENEVGKRKERATCNLLAENSLELELELELVGR